MKVNIEIPTNLTEKQTKLLEEFDLEESTKEKVSTSTGSSGFINSAWTRLQSFLGTSDDKKEPPFTTANRKQKT